MSLKSILAGLNAAHVQYVVIGGVAATAHGSLRVTNDLDICYDPRPENRERLAGVLVRWHAYLRGIEPGLPFALDARVLRDAPVMTLTTDEGDLDVMDRVAGVGDFAVVEASSEPVDVLGLGLRVLTLDALIASKRAAGRPKDRESLLELEALREERRRRGRR